MNILGQLSSFFRMRKSINPSSQRPSANVANMVRETAKDNHDHSTNTDDSSISTESTQTPIEQIAVDRRHSIIVSNNRAINRSPYYALVLFILSVIGLCYSIFIFFNTMQINKTNLFIPSTASDTAVTPIPTDLHVLPVYDQEFNPGKTLSTAETDLVVKEYLIDSLNDCFSMNYLNSSNVLSKCKSNHLDTETDTQDIFIELLEKSNYLDIMRKYETSAKLHIDEDSIELKSKAIAKRRLGDSSYFRSRAVWIYQLNMHFTMEKVKVTSPKKWEVEIIRESAFTKQFPVSIFKIRDLE